MPCLVLRVPNCSRAEPRPARHLLIDDFRVRHGHRLLAAWRIHGRSDRHRPAVFAQAAHLSTLHLEVATAGLHRARHVGHQRDTFPLRLALGSHLTRTIVGFLAVETVAAHRRHAVAIILRHDETVVCLPKPDDLTDFKPLRTLGTIAVRVGRILVALSSPGAAKPATITPAKTSAPAEPATIVPAEGAASFRHVD